MKLQDFLDNKGYTIEDCEKKNMIPFSWLKEYSETLTNKCTNIDVANESEAHERGERPNVNNYPTSGFSFRQGADFLRKKLLSI